MRRDDLLKIAGSSDREALRSVLVGVAKDLGFDRIGVFLAIDLPGSRPFFQMIDNTPPAFREKTHDYADSLRDPVLGHLKRSSRPIVYDQSTYVDAMASDLWEEQAPYGFKTGIALALHMPQGKHVAIGVDRDQALPDDEGELLRMMGAVHLMASFSIEAASRILGADSADDPAGWRLTPREREVLHWTSLGKSSWVIGTILGISESTVKLHLRHAMHKLNCSSKHVAAYRAATLGLIGP